MNEINDNDVVKHREIHFTGPHGSNNQALCAEQLLLQAEGIEIAKALSPTLLKVSYHLQFFTFATLEKVLSELGFHLDNSLLQKLKRAVYQYTEDVQRENFGFVHDHHQHRDIFIQRYRKLRHGCQDGRPEHWRTYR